MLKRLRAATASLHRTIEQRVDVISPGLTLARYRGILGRFLGYYKPLEGVMARVEMPQPLAREVAARRKVPALTEDLAALGMTAKEICGLPRCAALPTVAVVGHALGCMYVLEGATLGGQVIVPRVAASVGVGPGSGASFFAGYGAETGQRWAQTCELLETMGRDPATADAMVSGAVGTFETLADWFEDRGG
jgi:heme oxygenase (biliverdin-IX-beta and delta-forming)